MSSPFHGCWKLYGRENAECMMESLRLPTAFKCAMKHVKTCESIHVNGDNVHVSVYVPEYSIPAHGKDINFAFGVEHEQSLPFGGHGKGVAQKESETKWVATMTQEKGTCSIVREIRNGEMWVTIEAKGVKCIRKFERCMKSCEGQRQCPSASQFQGNWVLYGSDNFDKFMEAIGVPAHWRCVFANMHITESIHVNGNDVHIKVNLPEVKIPCHSHEISFKFGESHELALPFGVHVKAQASKVSDSKWHAKLTCAEKAGEGSFTREMVGDEMWTTIEFEGKRVVHKYERFGGDAASCTKSMAACPTKASC